MAAPACLGGEGVQFAEEDPAEDAEVGSFS